MIYLIRKLIKQERGYTIICPLNITFGMYDKEVYFLKQI